MIMWPHLSRSPASLATPSLYIEFDEDTTIIPYENLPSPSTPTYGDFDDDVVFVLA